MRGLPEFQQHPETFKNALAEGRYRAWCQYVVDGDTLDVVIDLGLEQYVSRRVRVYDINTAELRDKDLEERERARLAKAFVISNCYGKPLLVETFAVDDKYGRYATRVWYPVTGAPSQPYTWKDLGVELIEAGLATLHHY